MNPEPRTVTAPIILGGRWGMGADCCNLNLYLDPVLPLNQLNLDAIGQLQTQVVANC